MCAIFIETREQYFYDVLTVVFEDLGSSQICIIWIEKKKKN